MAGIDYTIPGQFKGIQLESPMNAMAQAMQLRNLQETSEINALRAREASQMNALKTQEYQRGVENRNKLARIHADPKVKIGSPEYLERVYTEVPDLYNDIATKIANRESVLSQIETREAAAQKSKFDLDLAKRKEERDALDLRLKQFNETFPAYNIKSEQDVEARILAMANDETLGPLATRFGSLGDTLERNKAEFRRDPRNYVARLAGTSAEEILKAADARETEDYNNYKVAEVFAGRTPVDRDTYLRSRREPQAAMPAPAPAAVTAPATVDTTAPVVATTAADGSKVFPPVTKIGQTGGFDYLDPTAQRLLQLAATAKTTNEAEAYRSAAAKIQTAFEKDVEEKRKAGQLTGEFFNVALARQKVQELRKLPPTKDNLEVINDLLDLIKTAKEGKAPKVHVNVPVSVSTEKKYGEKFAGNIADSDVALRDAAERAPDTANTANRVLSLLQSGQVITGSAANIKLQLAKLLNLGGGSDSEAITNTEVLMSSLAESTLGAIKSSGLGSGQGFTDKDREFLERAKSGQITYEASSLRHLAELAHKASTATAAKWNKRVKEIPKSAIEGTGISTAPVEVAPVYRANSGAQGAVDVMIDGKLKRFKNKQTLDAYKAAGGKVD